MHWIEDDAGNDVLHATLGSVVRRCYEYASQVLDEHGQAIALRAMVTADIELQRPISCSRKVFGADECYRPIGPVYRPDIAHVSRNVAEFWEYPLER